MVEDQRGLALLVSCAPGHFFIEDPIHKNPTEPETPANNDADIYRAVECRINKIVGSDEKADILEERVSFDIQQR